MERVCLGIGECGRAEVGHGCWEGGNSDCFGEEDWRDGCNHINGMRKISLFGAFQSQGMILLLFDGYPTVRLICVPDRTAWSESSYTPQLSMLSIRGCSSGRHTVGNQKPSIFTLTFQTTTWMTIYEQILHKRTAIFRGTLLS
jgi:hypothetical protein